MKKLVFTGNLPVLKSRRYVYGDPILEWARDDDPILEALARLSGAGETPTGKGVGR